MYMLDKLFLSKGVSFIGNSFLKSLLVVGKLLYGVVLRECSWLSARKLLPVIFIEICSVTNQSGGYNI